MKVSLSALSGRIRGRTQPITSTCLAGKELLAGSYDWTSLVVIFGTSCLYALAALIVAVKLFQREEVLFRT